jgi:hypothetical protein
VTGSCSRRNSNEGPDELLGGEVTAPEAGGKTGRHAHLVAGARGCLDAVGATGLLGDGDLRHAVTLASQQSMRSWPGPSLYAAAPDAPVQKPVGFQNSATGLDLGF